MTFSQYLNFTAVTGASDEVKFGYSEKATISLKSPTFEVILDKFGDLSNFSGILRIYELYSSHSSQLVYAFSNGAIN